MLRFPVGSACPWRDGSELTLIDTGTADRAAEIEEALDGELRRIVLTHWHEDHTGSAAERAGRHGAEVVAHVETPVFGHGDPIALRAASALREAADATAL
nr:MBL fold metallo-hydrolase [Streptomyces sp. SP17BM10]